MAVFYVGTIGDKPWFGFSMWVEVKSIMAANSQNAPCCWYKYLSLLTKFSQKRRCSLTFKAFLETATWMLSALSWSQNTTCANKTALFACSFGQEMAGRVTRALWKGNGVKWNCVYIRFIAPFFRKELLYTFFFHCSKKSRSSLRPELNMELRFWRKFLVMTEKTRRHIQ
jgi:hypothetical protein